MGAGVLYARVLPGTRNDVVLPGIAVAPSHGPRWGPVSIQIEASEKLRPKKRKCRGAGLSGPAYQHFGPARACTTPQKTTFRAPKPPRTARCEKMTGGHCPDPREGKRSYRRILPRSARRETKSRVEKKRRVCNTRTSKEVTHPSTTLAQARLTSEF